MRVLRSPGTPTTSLHDIFRAIVVSRIQYTAQAWSGMSSATDRARLDSLLGRGKRFATAAMTFRPSPNSSTQSTMTSSTASKPTLHPYFLDQTNIPYRVCTRPHNMTIINKTKFLNDTDFIIRMLYRYSYTNTA